MKNITEINIENLDGHTFENRLADCVILTHDRKVLLQYRPKHWGSNPDGLNLFGGHVDEGESVMKGLLRELNEELGALLEESDVKFIGAVSEAWADHKEFVHVYFWHDKDNKITGCYEAEARRFDSVEEALAQPKVMEYTVWALLKCQKLGLI